jgi:uncharacterized protein (TIGR03437 family)
MPRGKPVTGKPGEYRATRANIIETILDLAQTGQERGQFRVESTAAPQTVEEGVGRIARGRGLSLITSELQTGLEGIADSAGENLLTMRSQYCASCAGRRPLRRAPSTAEAPFSPLETENPGADRHRQGFGRTPRFSPFRKTPEPCHKSPSGDYLLPEIAWAEGLRERGQMTKTGLLLLWGAGALLPALQAQTNCPAINFQQGASASSLRSDSARTIIVRQADGTYTAVAYSVNPATIQTTHQVTKTGSTANYQQSFIGCAGLGTAVTRHPTPASAADPMGISALSGPVTADLAGTGYGALVGVWMSQFGEELLVEKAATDYSVATSTGYTVGQQPDRIIVADFNGDGKKDVAVIYAGPPTGSTPGGVSLLLGNGDGTLKPAVNYPTGPYPLVATAYDFNGDGLPDLAVVNYDNTIKILLANADGTFHSGNTYTLAGGNSINVSSLAAADVTGDGKPDLLIFEGSAGIAVLNGKGDGTFQTGAVLPSNVTYGEVGTGDFNKDGIPDIAIAGYGAGVEIMLGLGAGKFATPLNYAVPGGLVSFFVKDFDGDGNPDLIFAQGHPDGLTPGYDDTTVAVLFGKGDGTFYGPSVALLDGDKNDQTYAPTNVAIADVNGDGKPDLVTANASGKSLSVLLGQGGGAFQAPKSIALGTTKPNSLVAGDFNGDGKPDLVFTDGVANVGILLNNGDGTFPAPVMLPVNGTTPKFVVAGDFNGDGKLDLAVANAGSNNISVLLGSGNGGFQTPVNFAVGANPVNLIAGDFNGDGKLDLAVANSGTFSSAGTNTGSISVLLGKGDGTFQAAVNYSASQYPVFVTAADVNGDRKLDLVVAARGASGQDQLAVLLGNGNGTFQTAVAMNTEFSPTSIVVADFSGDGKPDLIVTHCCGLNDLTSLVGVGDGTFQPEVVVAGSPAFSAAAGDFNGDGKPDLAVTSFAIGTPHVITTFLNISATQGSLALTSAAGNPLQAPPVAQFSIATAKGSDLATGILVNTAAAPTTTLGTTVNVQDAQGVTRPAQLFYVSPTQVNFLIPQATAIGNATVTITSGDGFISVGTVAVAAVAPSVFTLNANSLVAAYVQRVHGDGTQSIENLYAVDAAGNVTFPPIDMGPSTDQVYLNLFGTGIAGRSSLTGVAITVGNTPTSALYAGPSSYPGEDQVAILLPRSLAGTGGAVNIVMKVDGKQANTTTLNIK